MDILKAGSQGGVQDFLPLNEEGDQTFEVFDPGRARKSMTPQRIGSQVGELQHYYVSPGFYLWTQGLHNCVDYAFLFVEIVEGGGGGDGHLF